MKGSKTGSFFCEMADTLDFFEKIVEAGHQPARRAATQRVPVDVPNLFKAADMGYRAHTSRVGHEHKALLAVSRLEPPSCSHAVSCSPYARRWEHRLVRSGVLRWNTLRPEHDEIGPTQRRTGLRQEGEWKELLQGKALFVCVRSFAAGWHRSPPYSTPLRKHKKRHRPLLRDRASSLEAFVVRRHGGRSSRVQRNGFSMLCRHTLAQFAHWTKM